MKLKPYVRPKPGSPRAKRAVIIRHVIGTTVAVSVPVIIFMLVKSNRSLTNKYRSLKTQSRL